MGVKLYLHSLNRNAMRTKFTNVIQILDYYKDEAKCIELLEARLWKGKPVCPHCNYSDKIYRTNRGYRCASKECGKKFSVKVGTIYENSKIPLRYWFAAIYLVSAHKKGISSHQIARDLGVTQKTGWFLLHRIREMLNQNGPELSGMVEADETYVGGSERNKHQSAYAKGQKIRNRKKYGTLQAGHDKAPVLGMVERGGRVVTKVTDNTKGKTLQLFIRDNVAKGSTLYTDEHPGYIKLGTDYEHDTVQHNMGEYGRGPVHINSIEGYWSLLKRQIYGIHHFVSAKHLQRYCNESAYRFNSRKLTDTDRFHVVIEQSKGRLKYEDLIAKN